MIPRRKPMARGQPLKRTPFTRSPDPGTPVRRGPVKQRAVPVPSTVRQAVYRRDEDTCQRCGLEVGAGNRQLQHRVARQAGGRAHHWRMSALVLLCGSSSLTGCHGEVESHPDRSRDEGFRVPQGVEPTAHPLCRFDGRRYLLDDDGGRTLIAA